MIELAGPSLLDAGENTQGINIESLSTCESPGDAVGCEGSGGKCGPACASTTPIAHRCLGPIWTKLGVVFAGVWHHAASLSDAASEPR